MVRLFKVFIPVSILTLLISETLLMTVAFACRYMALPDGELFLTSTSGIVSIGLVVLTMVIGLYLHDLYSEIRSSPGFC